MSWKPGDSYFKQFTTRLFATGVAADADALPVATITKNGTDDGASPTGWSNTLTVTKIDTGRYITTGTIPLTYAVGDHVELSVAATVDSVPGKKVKDSFRLDSHHLSDLAASIAGLPTDADIAALVEGYAPGHVFYVNSAYGSDGNDGLTPATAVASFYRLFSWGTGIVDVVDGPKLVLVLSDLSTKSGGGNGNIRVDNVKMQGMSGVRLHTTSDCTLTLGDDFHAEGHKIEVTGFLVDHPTGNGIDIYGDFCWVHHNFFLNTKETAQGGADIAFSGTQGSVAEHNVLNQRINSSSTGIRFTTLPSDGRKSRGCVARHNHIYRKHRAVWFDGAEYCMSYDNRIFRAAGAVPQDTLYTVEFAAGSTADNCYSAGDTYNGEALVAGVVYTGSNPSTGKDCKLTTLPASVLGLAIPAVTTTGSINERIKTAAAAVWDEALTGATHNVPTSAGRRLRQLASFALADGAVLSATPATVTIDGGSDTPHIYDENLIVIVEGAGAGQCRMILTYDIDGADHICTVARSWEIPPDGTSTYQILGFSSIFLSQHGRAAAGDASTITLDDTAEAAANTYIGHTIALSAGTGTGQARLITAYTAGRVATVSPVWDVVPDTTSVYRMWPVGRSCVEHIGGAALAQVTTAIFAKTGIVGNAAQSFAAVLKLLLAHAAYNFAYDGTNLKLYDSDNTTLLATIPLQDKGARG